MAKRGEAWSDDEVLALISIWSDEPILKMLATSHKNADIYGKISSKLETLGFKRDLKQCRTKVKHLKTTYKKYKDALARSRAARVKEPKFFEQLDIFLGDQPEAIGVDGPLMLCHHQFQQKKKIHLTSASINFLCNFVYTVMT